jgi:formamidopyrimidine-DNA glycosylase
MPEIAEVEVLCRQLRGLVGANIVGVESEDSKLVGLDGARGRVAALRRHGKLLGFELEDGNVLACHLRMTGALTFTRQPHTRAVIHFDAVDAVDARRDLYFSDPRRFGTLAFTPSTVFASNLGPDLLDDIGECTLQWQRVRRLRRPIKAVLLDQNVIAGIGNYMADETLFDARIHPQTPASLLRAELWSGLCGRAYTVALRSLMLGGVSLRDYKHADGGVGSAQTQLRCYGRAGQPCLVCASTLERTVVAGRGSTFCGHCQAQIIRYTNYRLETSLRRVLPQRSYYGSTSWHPQKQWLLDAFDLDKGEIRTFALADIHHLLPSSD